MSSHARSPASEQLSAEPRRSGVFRGLVEGIRTRRERSAVLGILESAVSEGDVAALDSALPNFAALPQSHRAKIMLSLQKELEYRSSFPYETTRKASSVSVLGRFFSEAAKSLPLSEDGAKETAPYGRAISLLRKIALDNSHFRPSEPSHVEARLSCVSALWELEYGSFGFWKELADDRALRPFVIGRLLEMEPTEKFTEHGWYLLQQNLGELARDIALSQSPARRGFFMSMLLDDDPAVVKAALAGAIYLRPVTQEFIDAVGDLTSMDGVSQEAKDFISAAILLPHLESAGESQFYASGQLIALYSARMPHLRSLMHEIGREMADIFTEPGGRTAAEQEEQRQRAALIIAHLHLAGIKVDGFDVNVNYGG
jgi:hypothetical protein